MAFGEITETLKHYKCPRCGVLGSMYILQSQAVVQCNRCHASYLDPFERGPWEEGIIDTLDEEMVSSYEIQITEAEETQENRNLMEFLKFYFGEHAPEEIEDKDLVTQQQQLEE